ncbi:MAG: site-specific DNA-methyltransferase [Gammaproteobacteria bacterium AqS3]|nr:site-specific DNA-methyltransferase [Gammaproteobacteria bacterium AqS3]
MSATTPTSQNRTLTCTPDEMLRYSREILSIARAVNQQDIDRRLIGGDFFDVAPLLPHQFVDLLILDPPYNLQKNFHGNHFSKLKGSQYADWFEKMIDLTVPLLRPDATLYACADWKTSTLIQPILDERFQIQNRITWEREKGRGAKRNWKNNTEDIWFCTNSSDYYFDVESVKLKRRVLAPYRVDGNPKDWDPESDGNYRLTHPSNIWTDLTVPFWSMPENTRHPTQKPEKLLAKLILASSREGDFVFDPFLGSGTAAVVAEKLNRRWAGVEINEEYLCWAQKRIVAARVDPTIQGYSDRVFWERNSLSDQRSRNRLPAR